MNGYFLVRNFHIATVIVSISLFILRFFWLNFSPGRLQQCWVRIVPHLNDTLMLLSGLTLVVFMHAGVLLTQDSWLTEKLIGVIIYIAAGSIALGRRPRSQKVRLAALVLALAVVALVIRLAITKSLLLG
ncbi:siroheme synthase [Erwinia sp. OLTSP20]|uniref:SirB2 family protein n=1 Tax=unclassified Erwinia TaxID=2622719 RepID=UPI000C19E48C|nr:MULTISPECIES: SirB2 family protein [unclassified Erwinia]PIJ49966.1 siroheme synthase [Erwinia sp. OAMSP11]PIJ71386.1 siroheme synthase [Erwinia sp. OLSSP12]PIJ80621.1 siroheme synthase [Erwinia sp. OLCASP19]PIJ82783.1 siroheme synthase [Erwinia sp. OLMTSP26]PIJ85468.1 siroheme synthase [Erwinia sp. OLMDSP33]